MNVCGDQGEESEGAVMVEETSESHIKSRASFLVIS